MTDAIIITAVGALAGLHSASWGAYKDSPHEAFKTGKYLRSAVIGTAGAWLTALFLDTANVISVNMGVFYAIAVIAERALTELYKGYFRNEPQDKYRIPSAAHLMGNVVKNTGKRLAAGVAFTAAFTAFALWALNTQPGDTIDLKATGIVFGLIGGLLIAVGGCLKDAPIEGFSKTKFMRSPLIASIAGLFLSGYTANPGMLMLSAMGLERAATEAYKTFVARKIPGKFKAEKPLNPEWLAKRRIFLAPYALTLMLFILLLQQNIALR
jgi:hypothetical protein